MQRILLAGKTGQVGSELKHTLAPLGSVLALDRRQMDLTNPDSIRAAIRDTRPDIIVNAAGYTTVDQAESEPDLVMALNAITAGELAPGGMAQQAFEM